MDDSQTTFRKYPHLERLQHRACAGLTAGSVWVFPKLDGTNASAWWDQGIQGGSRKNHLSVEKDNAGFLAMLLSDTDQAAAIRTAAEQHPSWILYGEWLVPHTLKTYQEDAWRKFWVFDVRDRETGKFIPWDQYSEALRDLDLIPPITTIESPTTEQLREIVDTNSFLVTEGHGEGVVLKNYSWSNHEDKQPWAKIVLASFNNRSTAKLKVRDSDAKEAAIVDKYATSDLIRKTYAKVLVAVANDLATDTSKEGWQVVIETEHRGHVIPRLLSVMFDDFIEEELLAALKNFKNPTINFKDLSRELSNKVRLTIPELF